MNVYSIKGMVLWNESKGFPNKFKKVNRDYWYPNLDAEASLKLHGHYFGLGEWLIDIDFNFNSISTEDKNDGRQQCGDQCFRIQLESAIYLSSWIKSTIRDDKLTKIGI